LIYININFILRLLEKGIYIKNFNYGLTSLLFLMGFLIYWFYQCVLRKSIYKIIFTVLICMGGAFYYKEIKFVKDIFNYYVKNIIILNDLIYQGAITYFYQYKIILIIIMPLITALILWVTFRFMKKFILIVSLGTVISLWFSNSYVVVKEYLFVYIFISSLSFIIMSYIKKIQKYKEEGVKVSLRFHWILLYGVIISLIISKITLTLPQEYKGRDLTYFGNYFENKFSAEPSGISAANKSRYSLSSSGYSGNDKRLGGSISLSYQEIFKVKSDKPYYLKGNVMDLYDGYKWDKANESYFKKLSGVDMDYVKFGMSEIMDIKKSLTIYPDKKFKTNTIFVPNYAFNVRGFPDTLFYDKTPIILSEKVVTKPYNVEFYEYTVAIDTIEDVRDSNKKFLEDHDLIEASNLPMSYYLQPKTKNINTVINKNALIDNFSYRQGQDVKVAQDYGKYLQVPGNISKRTYDLVQNITKDASTSIDKVLEIKKYLTKNYVYDLQVSEIPEGSEFIDYFLFVQKKGYCTYFNTAMTIMCRMVGVPARYVEGFKTPNKKNEAGLHSISNADAHAWCEVLLGAFEYSNMWTVADASPSASEDMQKKLKKIEEEQRNAGNTGGAGIDIVRIPENIIEGIDPLEETTENKLGVLSDSQIKALNILTTVMLFMLMRVILVMKRRSNILKSKKVAPLYNYFIYRLAAIRIVKPEYQGDLEFAEEISNVELKEKMKILVRGAYEEVYSKHSVETLNNLEYYEFLEKHLKDYEGVVRYILNKYLGYFK